MEKESNNLDDLLRQSKITQDEYRFAKLTIRMAKLMHEWIVLEQDINNTKLEVDKLGVLLTCKGQFTEAFSKIYNEELELIIPEKYRKRDTSLGE